MRARSATKTQWIDVAVSALRSAPLCWAICATACGGAAGAEDGCPDLDGCGGSPVGSWQLQSVDPVCQYVPPLTYSVPTVAPPQTMLAQSPGQTAPAPKSAGDWCSSLVFEPPGPNTPSGSPAGQVTQVLLAHAAGDVTAATAVLSANHNYSTAVDTKSTTLTHFAPTCITAYGAHPTCAELATELSSFESAMPNYANMVCNDATDGGCDCSYVYVSTAADTGSWRIAGNNILYFISAYNQFQPIVETTFCAPDKGSSLTVTGRNGVSLFAVTGLRTLRLAPAGM
jgi:hypothetical protein